MLRQCLRILQSLLDPGQPLEALRFDPKAFGEVVDRHVGRVIAAEETDRPEVTLFGPAGEAHGDDRAPWERLLDLCYPGLVQADWIEQAQAALRQVLGSDRLGAEEQMSVAFALATLHPPGEESGSMRSILAVALFPIQLEEMARTPQRLTDAVHALASGVRSGEVVDLDALKRQHPEAWAAAEQILQGSPELMRSASREVDRMIEQTRVWLTGPEPPPLLTMDVFLRVLAEIVEYKQRRDAPDALFARLEACLGPDVQARLQRWCMENGSEAGDQSERDGWHALAMSLQATFGEVVVWATGNPASRMQLRDEEEQAFGANIPNTPAELEERMAPYVDWLRRRGETAAAARVLEALPVLRAGLQAAREED